MSKGLKYAGFEKKQFLIPVKDIHLYAGMPNDISPVGSDTYLYILASIALFTLLIACINFMNLTTARSANRAKEVGIIKVLGTERKNLMMQFLTESTLMVILSLILAIGIAALVVGVVLGLVFHPSVPEVVQPYLPIAVVAALDAVFGGLRAYLDRIFDSKVFVISFVFNVLVAALIVYLGDQLGVGTQLSTAIIVVLGIRIFGNAAALRRKLFGA